MPDVIILELIVLFFGILLCFRGLSFYRILQLLLVATAFGMVGMSLHGRFGYSWLYLVAFAMAILGGIIGYKYYKVGLFVGSAFSTFVIVFSYFWRKIAVIISDCVGEVLDSGALFRLYVTNIFGGVAVKDSLEGIATLEIVDFQSMVTEVSEALQTGILWATGIAVVVGIIAVLVGDYAIIFLTAFLGGTFLAFLTSIYIPMGGSPLYIILVIAFAIFGMVIQIQHKKRRRSRRLK